MNRRRICSGWEGCSCWVLGECIFCKELLKGGLAAEWGEKGSGKEGGGKGSGEGRGWGREGVGGGKGSGEGRGWGREGVVQRAEGWWVTWI